MVKLQAQLASRKKIRDNRKTLPWPFNSRILRASADAAFVAMLASHWAGEQSDNAVMNAAKTRALR